MPLICPYTSKVSSEKEVQTSNDNSCVPLQLVWSTFVSQEQATPIIKSLVEEQLIVCAWLSPQGGLSIYEWQGELCEEAEIAVIFKVLPSQHGAFVSRLRELHPYEVPAIITIDADKVSPEYLNYANKV